ncbi:MAG: hypothetical protein ACLPYS_08365 [Vulcanimicrobiaceae bacterium]
MWIIARFACVWFVPFGGILNALHHRELGMMVGGAGLAGILVCFTAVKLADRSERSSVKGAGGGRSVSSRGGPRVADLPAADVSSDY